MRLHLSLTKEKSLAGISLMYLRSIVRTTCDMAVPEVFGRPMTVTLEVVSTTDRRMQELNMSYQKKNRPTDILSFGEKSSPLEWSQCSGKSAHLGQIFFSPDFIRRSAKEDGVSWKHEFTYVFSHGVLHLLGFDHSPEMFALQDQVTEKLIRPKIQR